MRDCIRKRYNTFDCERGRFLSKKKAYRVVLTRSKDVFVPLDERTRRAHEVHADLFISIHANYAKPSVSGVETFWFDGTGVSCKKNILPFTDSISRAFKKRADESTCLASCVHNALYAQLKNSNPECVDRATRAGGIQVLMGAHMPAILIEVGFLSNQKEAHLLKTKAYQQVVAQGICEGIERYVTQKSSDQRF